MTPKLVSRRYSKGRVLLMVFKNGYRNIGMYAAVPEQSQCLVELLDTDSINTYS